MSEPVDVYIDVDGVINAVCLSTPRDWGWERVEVTEAEGFTITYSPDLVDRLNALAERPDVSMHWLTTWEDRAAKALAPLIGLNGEAWPVLGAAYHYSHEVKIGWWKHAALIDYYPPRGRRAVWIDDDIAFDPLAREWVATFGDRLLVISPETRRGITRAEMERIEAFVAPLSDAQPPADHPDGSGAGGASEGEGGK